jgi:hypothetical protein
VNAPAKVIRRVFKRLETDAEFLERMTARASWARREAKDLDGETLDFFAWWNFKMERKIVEDVA